MLKISKLSKTYKKADKKALDDVSFSIQSGEFVALLGPNGAGKSTLINVLGSNVLKDEGNVSIGEFNLETNELDTKKVIGIVPQEISFDPFFTVNEVLLNQSGYFGLKDNQAYIDEVLENLALMDKKYAKTRALSGGMKRRLLIAKALIHKPNLLILDEPTAGVDIELRQQLYVFLRKLHDQGTTIILTTHYLEEAEELCDRIILINHGKLVVDEDKNTLIKRLGSCSVLEFILPDDAEEKHLSSLSGFETELVKNTLRIKVDKKDIAHVFQTISHYKIPYTSFRIEEEDLEDVFLKLVK